MSRRADPDADSFDEFFRATKQSLLAMAYVLTGDLAAAQDLAQEALLRAWARWPRISKYDDPHGWTRRVLHNLAVDKRRSERVVRHVPEPQRSSPPPDELHLTLAAALRSLPAKQSMALVLHDGAGMSIQEVAHEMSVPEGTVKSWLSRGRASAAAALKPSVTPTKEGHAQR
jgi:RNA polymerase sigma-70 factor (sigma-E family)